MKLPVSGAVVFSIHTYLLRQEDLTAEQAGALAEFPLGRMRVLGGRVHMWTFL